jgi:hypothetical protein
MRKRVLLFRRQLGHRATVTGRDEDGLVAETPPLVTVPGRARHLPTDDPLEQLRRPARIRKGDDTHETRATSAAEGQVLPIPLST